MFSNLIHRDAAASSATNVPESEDFLHDYVERLFGNGEANHYGQPGDHMVYESLVFGDVRFKLPNPTGRETRYLFANYAWSSSLLVAELLGEAVRGTGEGDRREAKADGWRAEYLEPRLGDVDWSVEGESVIELGAGSGLAGIIAGAAGARKVVITDYPDEQFLANIEANVHRNMELLNSVTNSPSSSWLSSPECPIAVRGHAWGDVDEKYAASNGHGFTRVIAADTLWKPEQHENLAASIDHFLSREPSARAWVVAGFHTGRQTVTNFFENVQHQGRLVIEDAFEVSIALEQRAWVWGSRVGEDAAERKRWMLVAIMKRPPT